MNDTQNPVFTRAQTLVDAFGPTMAVRGESKRKYLRTFERWRERGGWRRPESAVSGAAIRWRATVVRYGALTALRKLLPDLRAGQKREEAQDYFEILDEFPVRHAGRPATVDYEKEVA